MPTVLKSCSRAARHSAAAVLCLLLWIISGLFRLLLASLLWTGSRSCNPVRFDSGRQAAIQMDTSSLIFHGYVSANTAVLASHWLANHHPNLSNAPERIDI